MSSIASDPSTFINTMLPPSPRPPVGRRSSSNNSNSESRSGTSSLSSTASTSSTVTLSVTTSDTADAPASTDGASILENTPRKRALTDSAEDREFSARTSPSFARPNTANTANTANTTNVTNTQGKHDSVGSLSLRGGGAFHIPTLTAQSSFSTTQPPMKTQNRVRRAHSAMTADNLDDEQEQKLGKIMRAVMIMRISKSDSAPIRIIPGLFIGSIGAAINKEAMLTKGITHVLCAAGGIKLYHPNDFVYKQVLIADTPGSDMYSHLGSCCSFIGRAISSGGKVLVHCFAGKSRSATVLASYLMLTKRVDMVTAIDMMRKKRPIVQPNPGFCAQLLKWNRYIKTLSPKGSSSGNSSGGSSSSNSSRSSSLLSSGSKEFANGGHRRNSSNSSNTTQKTTTTPITTQKKTRAPSPLSQEMDVGDVDVDL